MFVWWIQLFLFFFYGGIQGRGTNAFSFEKLMDALESFKGCVVGRNKDDIEEAIVIVSLCILDSSFQ